MPSNDAQQRIEAYLSKLRGQLSGMNDVDIHEIVEELRSHIMDKASVSGELTTDGVEAAVAALGNLEELAREYVTGRLLARDQVSRSPAWAPKTLFRWACLNVARFFVLLGSLVGYFIGGVLILCALLKPFHPRTAGVWIFPGSAGDFEISLQLGFGNAPMNGREVLGWWIVPIGVAVGWGLVMLTIRYVLLCVGQYRRFCALHRS